MSTKPVNVASVEHSIRMLEQYLDVEEIGALLSALQALTEAPDNRSCFAQMADAFAELGIQQGAVLTYAPYIGILLSDDPFSNENFNSLRDDHANQ